MSSLQQLRSFFKHSLAAVADEIFAVVEKAITEYQDELSRSEEKNSRLQNLLDIAVKHETKLYRADTEPRLQLPVCEEVPPQQQYHDQEWNPNLGQEDQNSMHIKEELMETSLGNEQESDTSYIFTSTCLQRDCDQELPQPSHEVHRTESTSIVYKHLTTETKEDHEHFMAGATSQAFSQPPSAVESTYPSSSPISCCKVCGKTFLKKTYFFKHVRMHTKVRERVCGVCGKQVEAEALKDHIQAHVQAHIDAQFTCHVCGKCYTNNSALGFHMRVHIGEKPYQCSVCDKGFPGITHLANHMRSHTGKKQYQCSVCGRGFPGITHLANHMRSHTGEKPYSCTVCGKGFSVSCNLTQHMMIHTGERPYHCPNCQKGFITMVKLRRHQNAVHMQGETSLL